MQDIKGRGAWEAGNAYKATPIISGQLPAFKIENVELAIEHANHADKSKQTCKFWLCNYLHVDWGFPHGNYTSH